MGIDHNTGYYSLREILGYNAKWNIVLSDRGRGKTWGTKWFLMGQKCAFMCLYRNTGDMEHAIGEWLDPIFKGDEKHEPISPERFEWDGSNRSGYNLMLDGVVIGYFRCITMVNHIKQETFPDNLNWMWIDEFIPMAYKKLPGIDSEGDALRVIYKTIDHDTAHPRETRGLKPLRVLMFANPFTWNNPILSYFHVLPKGPGIRRVGPDIVVEMLPAFETEKQGKDTIDDFLGDSVNKTNGWESEFGFVVDRVPKGSKPTETVRIGSRYYGLYSCGNGLIYCKSATGHGNVRRLGSMDGLTDGEVCLDRKICGRVIKDTMRKSLFSGHFRFTDLNTKFDFIRDIQSL